MEKYTPIKKSPIFFILLAAFLAACGLFTPNLTPESEPSPQMMISPTQINLDVTTEELREHDRSRAVATRVHDLVLEYLREHQNFKEKIEGRLVYLG